MLEVRYEDLARALREVTPSGAMRSTLVSGKLGAAAGLARRLRLWWCERQLRRLTDRALTEVKAEGTRK